MSGSLARPLTRQKIEREQADRIYACAKLNPDLSTTDLSARFSVARSTVQKIVARRKELDRNE